MEYLLADSFNELLRQQNLIPLFAIALGCGTGIIAIICGSVSGVCKARAREETKRELAAYVAEGTIDPDKAIAMLKAGEDSCSVNIGGEKFAINASGA